jgi:hypothetical protein
VIASRPSCQGIRSQYGRRDVLLASTGAAVAALVAWPAVSTGDHGFVSVAFRPYGLIGVVNCMNRLIVARVDCKCLFD